MRFGACRRGAARLGVLLLVAAGCLAYLSGVALAARGFAASSFSSPGGFAGPVGVAVDNSTGLSSGDVYVTDQGHGLLDKFTATGVFLSSVDVTGATLDQLTVDDYAGLTEGDVYVVDQGKGVVYRFSPGLALEGEIKGLSEPTGVAVDQAGNIFVSELASGPGKAKVLEYNTAGEPIDAAGVVDSDNAVLEGLNTPQALAVDASGTDLYLATASGTTKYTLTAGVYTASAEALDPAASSGVVLTGSGDVYVDQGSEIAEYEPTAAPAGGALLDTFGAGVLSGAGSGVGAGGSDVYVGDRGTNLVEVFEEGATPEAPLTTSAGEVKASTAALDGELKSGGGASGYYFAYNTGGSCEGGFTTTPGSASSGPVHTEATGLLPATQYMFCLVATNKYGTTSGQGVAFETKSAPPAVEGVSFSDVGSGSVLLSGRINALGTPTEYHFEYGTTTAYGTATPTASVGASQEVTSVQTTLDGLTPASEYHFRLVAKNANSETMEGSDIAFRTLPAGTLGLPDERVYEKVSPAEDHDANVYTPEVARQPLNEGLYTTHPFEAAEDGNAVVYVGDPTDGGTGQGGQGSGNNYLATRSPTGGWQQINIQPPGRYSAGYQGFSSNLSTGFLRSVNFSETGLEHDPLPLSPEGPLEGSEGGYLDLFEHSLGGGENYEPVYTRSATIHRSGGRGDDPLKVLYGGASADLSQVFFGANDALTTSAAEISPGPYGQYEGEDLYDSVDGRLSVINVLPDGISEANAAFGAGCLEGNGCFHVGGEKSGNEGDDLNRVISDDGTRVFWTDLNTGDLYVREDPMSIDATTVRVSSGPARYWTASVSGSKVFFTKNEAGQLGTVTNELYEYDLESGQTTDLTPGVEVVGVIGASEDGEYIYYVDGNDNLKLWHEGHSGVIATLADQDLGQGNDIPPYYGGSGSEVGDVDVILGKRTAEVTPDGLGLVFMSSQSLDVVGYPHGFPNGGSEEVYAYEAEDGGHLFCVSCSFSGEPAAGGAAGYLPIDWVHSAQPKWISNDGSRVFFDSGETLVSQDTNGRQDVYEWERDGAGSCREEDGCVYLLSGGTSSSASWLLGASANGDDVFIITRAPLVPGDPYESFALYDARVGGVQPLAPPACTGTGCQGVPPAPPLFATPASVTFGGVGNFPAASGAAGAGKGQTKPKAKTSTRAQKLASALKACRKQRRGRAACERRGRKRYGAKSNAKKSAAREGKSHAR
jgi:hypothetical protein